MQPLLDHLLDQMWRPCQPLPGHEQTRLGLTAVKPLSQQTVLMTNLHQQEMQHTHTNANDNIYGAVTMQELTRFI